jgi:hypothetical protein
MVENNVYLLCYGSDGRLHDQGGTIGKETSETAPESVARNTAPESYSETKTRRAEPESSITVRADINTHSDNSVASHGLAAGSHSSDGHVLGMNAIRILLLVVIFELCWLYANRPENRALRPLETLEAHAK